MLALDGPLDLKLHRGHVGEEEDRVADSGSPRPRPDRSTPLTMKARQLRMADDSTAVIVLSASPQTGVSAVARQERSEPTIPPPPSPQRTSCPPGPTNGKQASHAFTCADEGAPSQAARLLFPIGEEGGPHPPSSALIGQSEDRWGSPDLSADELQACRWRKCDLLFDSLQDLVDHINVLHVKPEKDSGYCCRWEGCPRKGRSFNARYKMLIHIRTHTNEKPHSCSTCCKSFSRLENLKIHNRSHTGEKPYVCPYAGCGKRYSNSSDRFKHTRTHYVEKPYPCKMAGCPKRYTDPSSLRKHVKAHGHFAGPLEGALIRALGPGGTLLKGIRIGGLDAGAARGSELSYVGGAHVIIPGGVAAGTFLGRGHLAPQETATGSLPLSVTSCLTPRPLDLSSTLAGLPILGLSEAPPSSPALACVPLGLSVVPPLGPERGGTASVGLGQHGEVGEQEVGAGGVLNLSPGTLSNESFSWVVIPSGTVLLRPAVVN